MCWKVSVYYDTCGCTHVYLSRCSLQADNGRPFSRSCPNYDGVDRRLPERFLHCSIHPGEVNVTGGNGGDSQGEAQVEEDSGQAKHDGQVVEKKTV
jgi:hypothetical protein